MQSKAVWLAVACALAGCGKKDGDKSAPTGSAAARGSASGSAKESGPITEGAEDPNAIAAPAGSGSATGSGSGAEGSGSDDGATAIEPDTTGPSRHEGKAKLAFTGAVETTVDNVPATCICHGDSATIEVTGVGTGVTALPFKLSMGVLTKADWASPPVMLTLSAPKKGMYGRNAAQPRKDDVVSVATDCSGATLDTVLKGIAGTKGEIGLKGQISCAVSE
jgi:hypothetical protein